MESQLRGERGLWVILHRYLTREGLTIYTRRLNTFLWDKITPEKLTATIHFLLDGKLTILIVVHLESNL